ncbi:TPA: PTS mannose/fructose/sorbose/N-acetylgalactosamine transporter subunit IIC, partial [Streptococcus suis]
CAAYLQLPVIGIAIVGSIFALKEFFNKPEQVAVKQEEAHDDWI